jgi:uncharacterized protein YcgI (DUF1989 family)
VTTDRLLPPRDRIAVELDLGEALRVTVVDGQQVPDIVLVRLDDRHERLSPTATQLLNGAFVVTTGHRLYSNRAAPLATVISCTVDEGVIVGGSCSEPLNYARFGIRDTPNCRSNLLEVGAPYGLEEPDVQHIFCPFMTVVSAPDGTYTIELPKCGPGDYVELRAEVALLVLLSNCPQERTPTNAFNPTRLHVWSGAPTEERPSLERILPAAARATG